MIFGIIWELISRQINTSLDVSPKFNSRIFFYLFLPSTVLESASILSNKWLLLNILPILLHSIVGTLLYGSAIAFTIHSMSKQDLFNIGTSSIADARNGMGSAQTATLFDAGQRNHWLTDHEPRTMAVTGQIVSGDDLEESTFLYEKSYVINTPMLEIGNLTLADCLIFGSIMSSLDSTTMLGAFSMFQVNEKLYYLVLGESLMNNAVVLIVFNLLLDFLNASRLTVVKIYIAIIQFFITLIGSIFVGLLLASVALLAVRLIKRFQVPSALTSYQNQCLAMIETLLVLKLAYLTYTLGSLAGLSSIVSLATFGVLQHQYISLNLNWRSQLTFRQVVLASKTMGFSLVYPLLGMLLVDVAYASQYVQQFHHQSGGVSPVAAMSIAGRGANDQRAPTSTFSGAATLAATKLTALANQANLFWNFKFLSLVTVISVAYRFGIVILLSLFCNLISNRRVKVRFREQLLMAYGGLKGPLAVALVHRLIEHEDHRDRLLRNKHLFMYTILFITLLSVVLKGALIRPLVEKLQISLDHPRLAGAASHKVVLFNAINNRVIECATQAINNMMGRSKSSYDRLFEFNESRIKPWLAREGTNTNWLSNLYDKLLLDKTLDSDSFYKSSAEPIAGSFWHNSSSNSQQRHRQLSSQNLFTGLPPTDGRPRNHHRGSRASVKLDTISENGGGFIDDDELNDAMNSHLGLSVHQQQAATNLKRQINSKNQQPSRRSKNSVSEARGSFKLRGDHGTTTTRDLKEFVMLNLKSDENELDHGKPKRRPSKSNGNRAGSVDETPARFSQSDGMLSSTSCDDELQPQHKRQSSSDKEGYISQLERHLESRKKAQATGPRSNLPTDRPLYVDSLTQRDELAAGMKNVANSSVKDSRKIRHEGREKSKKHANKQHNMGRLQSRVAPSSSSD